MSFLQDKLSPIYGSRMPGFPQGDSTRKPPQQVEQAGIQVGASRVIGQLARFLHKADESLAPPRVERAVRLRGTCLACPSASMTLKLGLEMTLKRMLPWVEQVVCVEFRNKLGNKSSTVLLAVTEQRRVPECQTSPKYNHQAKKRESSSLKTLRNL